MKHNTFVLEKDIKGIKVIGSLNEKTQESFLTSFLCFNGSEFDEAIKSLKEGDKIKIII